MKNIAQTVITNTRPEQIVDKNGVLTTRHKKMENLNTSNRINSAPPPSLAKSSRPLSNQSPAEIDVPLAENYYQQSDIFSKIKYAEYCVDDYARIIKDEIDKDHRMFAKLTEEGEHKRAEYYADPENGYSVKRHREDMQKYLEKIPPLEEALEELRDLALPYEDEFSARGGWSRFYQVTNSNGHVHSSTQCSTCFSTTQFHWHADRSGMSDDDIVDLAGSDACTVCFADAPVEKLAQVGRLETPDMTTKREERDAREAKRLLKAAEASEKGITNSDGSVLRVDGYTYKTERSAEQELVSSLIWLYQREREGFEGNLNFPRYESKAQQLFEAINNKRGGNREENIENIKAKAIAKLKREYKEAIPVFERSYNPDLLR